MILMPTPTRPHPSYDVRQRSPPVVIRHERSDELVRLLVSPPLRLAPETHKVLQLLPHAHFPVRFHVNVLLRIERINELRQPAQPRVPFGSSIARQLERRREVHGQVRKVCGQCRVEVPWDARDGVEFRERSVRAIAHNSRRGRDRV